MPTYLIEAYMQCSLFSNIIGTPFKVFTLCCVVQEEKISGLQSFADRLIQSRHYAAVEVAERRASILAHWSKLKSAMLVWRNKLGQSRSLQHFKRETDEGQAWMSEKMQTACDDSYKDPTNLPVRTASSSSAVLYPDDCMTTLPCVAVQ